MAVKVLKICSNCGRKCQLWRANPDLCINCCKPSFKFIQKPSKPIKKTSAKLSKKLRKYSSLREQFLRQHPICQAKVKCNGRLSTEVHHKRGRGKYLLDTTTWLATCHDCHCWIETNPKEAKELGLSENRLDHYKSISTL